MMGSEEEVVSKCPILADATEDISTALQASVAVVGAAHRFRTQKFASSGWDGGGERARVCAGTRGHSFHTAKEVKSAFELAPCSTDSPSPRQHPCTAGPQQK